MREQVLSMFGNAVVLPRHAIFFYLFFYNITELHNGCILDFFDSLGPGVMDNLYLPFTTSKA